MAVDPPSNWGPAHPAYPYVDRELAGVRREKLPHERPMQPGEIREVDMGINKLSNAGAGAVGRQSARDVIAERIQRKRTEIAGLQMLLDSLPAKLPWEADEALWNLLWRAGQ